MYFRNIKPSFVYNEPIDSVLCDCCAEAKTAKERVDCVNVFDMDESYCIPCWFEKVEENVKLCPKKSKLLATWYTASFLTQAKGYLNNQPRNVRKPLMDQME